MSFKFAFWAIGALVLFAAEAMAPGAFMLWFGFAAVAMALVVLVAPGLGWLAQAVLIGLGLLTPWMYAMGIIFGLIWVTCMVLGKRIEALRAGRDNA